MPSDFRWTRLVRRPLPLSRYHTARRCRGLDPSGGFGDDFSLARMSMSLWDDVVETLRQRADHRPLKETRGLRGEWQWCRSRKEASCLVSRA